MVTKLFEIRDRMTTIPALAVGFDGSDGYLVRRAGFHEFTVYLVKLASEHCRYSPHNWNEPAMVRTMGVAHAYIEENWETLASGDVVDVEFILGETAMPKASEEKTE